MKLKPWITWTFIGLLLFAVYAIATSVITNNNLGVGQASYNESGAYYGSTKAYARTADVVVCRGTSVADDLIKSFTCDQTCYSTDPDCSQEIQSAINTMHDLGGGHILVRDGQYNITAVSLYLESNIFIEGESWNTLLQAVGQKHIFNLNGTPQQPKENMRISNFHLDGTYITNQGVKPIFGNNVNKVVIDNNFITNAPFTCIGADDMNDFIITANYLENCSITYDGNGIGVGGNSSLGLISNNRIHSIDRRQNYSYGIFLEKFGGTEIRNVNIENNIITNVTNGIGVWGTRNINIIGNTVVNNTWGFRSQGQQMHNINIVGNVFANNLQFGIRIEDGDVGDININENVIYNNSAGGIIYKADNASISNNIVFDNGVNGIYVVKTSNIWARNINIIGNLCNNNDVGIMIEMTNNSVISGNNCFDNKKHGIQLNTGSSHNVVNGNVCGNNGRLINNTYDGINLAAGANYNTIIGNNCASDFQQYQRYGLSENSAADWNLIVGNTLKGQTAGVNKNGANTIFANNFNLTGQ